MHRACQGYRLDTGYELSTNVTPPSLNGRLTK